MSDKGILFSAPMVRALLDGRKTQTRRLCAWANNPNSPQLTYIVSCDEPGWFGDEEGEVRFRTFCAPGDRLWVREEWSTHAAFDGIRAGDVKAGSMVYTRADDLWHNAGDTVGAPYGRRRASMHMPRKLSRLWLSVTDVRVQRLQDCSEADAIGEGVSVIAPPEKDGWRHFGVEGTSVDRPTPVKAYETLWDSLHTKAGERWDDNPWVVAVSFDVHHGNVDQVLA